VIAFAIAAAAVAFAVSAALTRNFCSPHSRFHWLDHPNERSMHSRPTPRTGGLAIVLGVALATPVWLPVVGADRELVALFVAASLVAAISFVDDRRGLPVLVRMTGHVVASGIIIAVLEPGWLYKATALAKGWPDWVVYPVVILALVWMINLYNFMDGMDGLAGGMAVIGFGAMAVFGLISGHVMFVVLNITVVAASAGFLAYNLPPARIFMGDSGSATLGLLAGGAGLWGIREGIFPAWAVLLIFSPFVVDASVTLVRRALRGERIWEAHKTHYYQRLVQSGFGYRRTVVYEYALMIACSTSAILGAKAPVAIQNALIGFWLVAYVVLMVLVDRMKTKAKT